MKTSVLIVFFLLINSQLAAQNTKKDTANALKINTGFQHPQAELVRRLTNHLMQQANIPLIFQVLPNQRALINANNGEDDGEAARIFEISKYYPNLLPTNEAIHEIDVVVVSKQQFSIPDTSDFSLFHIGTIRGMKIAELKAANNRPKSLIKSTNIHSLLHMLDGGRIDLALVDKIGFFNAIQSIKNANYFMYQPSLIQRDLYFHLHKKHQNLLPILNQALLNMKKDGSFEIIKAKFFNQFDQVLNKSVTIIPYEKK